MVANYTKKILLYSLAFLLFFLLLLFPTILKESKVLLVEKKFLQNKDKLILDIKKADYKEIEKDFLGPLEDDSIITPMSDTNIAQLQENEPITPNNNIVPNNAFKKTITSFFWVGEESGPENDNIANYASTWDDYWMEHFGGIDSSTDRCDYLPCSFTPEENPFYFALPYNDLGNNDKRKESSKNIPWYDDEGNKKSILKNKWIEIKYNNKYCYAQWEDVGPKNENDFDYVFGDSEPKNKFGVKAGLDVSPAVRDCLLMKDNDYTEWRFIEFENVPNGPWKNIISDSNIAR